MKVVITGALGFLGALLTKKLLQKNTLATSEDKQVPITKLILFDIFPAQTTHADDPRVSVVIGDLTDKATIEKVLQTEEEEDLTIFHLGSIMSGQGEENFDLAMNVNLQGTLQLLELCRKRKRKARFIFTSTTAIYDAKDLVTDETRLLPHSTYGTTKACIELLICDYSRRGFVDGRIGRLPTVIIRPGKPNKAASSFCSSIFREPLNGIDYSVPVSPSSKAFLIGYSTVIESLIKIHDFSEKQYGYDRTCILPGFCASVTEMIESLNRVAKEVLPDRTLGKISFDIDPAIDKLVNGWPANGVSENAKRLGLGDPGSLDDVIKDFIRDFLK